MFLTEVYYCKYGNYLDIAQCPMAITFDINQCPTAITLDVTKCPMVITLDIAQYLCFYFPNALFRDLSYVPATRYN